MFNDAPARAHPEIKMTPNTNIKTMLLSLSASGLVMLSLAATAHAEDLGAGHCTHGAEPDQNGQCAISTVCGSLYQHVVKPFSGDFDAYFSKRAFSDVTCEIMVHAKQVHYQCQDRFGAKHRGQLAHTSYPTSKDAASHYAVCKSILSRYPTDAECETPEKPNCGEPKTPDCNTPDCKKPKKPECGETKKPDCGEPKGPDCGKPGKPDCGEPKKPDCGEPKGPDCGKPGKPDCNEPKTPDCEKPDCEKPDCGDKGEEKPKEDGYRESCVSPHGRCSVSGFSRPSQGMPMTAQSKFSVDCKCNTGAAWGYSERSTFFETVGAAQLEDVCEAEVQLCEQPLEGGQAAVFGLEEHATRKSNAQCSTAFGQCRVDADAAGNGYVNCQCFAPGSTAKVGMVYGMEPGVQGATDQCFVELESCEIEKDHCPGGCDKNGDVGNPGGGVMDCSLNPQEDRGPMGAMLALFACIGGLRLRRRR